MCIHTMVLYDYGSGNILHDVIQFDVMFISRIQSGIIDDKLEEYLAILTSEISNKQKVRYSIITNITL